MKKCLFLFVLLFSVISVYAQGEFVVEIDPETGVFTKTGNLIPGIHWVYPDARAYDEVNGLLIFQGGDPTPDHLYSVDVANGNVVSDPLFPTLGTTGTISEPQFDNVTGTLFGIFLDNTTTSFYLVSIDPVTGIHSQVGTSPISGLWGVSQGMTTYDEVSHKYILSASNDLFSIDVLTGSATVIPLGLQPGNVLINLCFNNDNDSLYGLVLENSTQLVSLVTINPLTGNIYPVGNGTNFASGNGGATIDHINRRYIFYYSSMGNSYLSVMDLDNGNILFHNQIVLSNADNVHSLKYDNIRQKLFAIHWDELIETSNVADVKVEYPDIFPNPVLEKLSVQFSECYQNVNVVLYNGIGQKLRTYNFKQTQECSISLQDIIPGPYFLKLDTGKRSFTRRFVKE